MTRYDVFLSYARQDGPSVELLARKLLESGLTPFLDTWHLVPGEPWQEALEAALDRSAACAVFLGPNGLGPWENEEMRSALDQRVHSSAFRVIPVLLPGALMPERGRLPRFLSRLTWVDCRRGLESESELHRLWCGIKGLSPGPPPSSGAALGGVCPFRGLEAFQEEHVDFFFGRGAMIQWLVEGLRNSRFLGVLGQSGSGKSSLVNAGLVPALRRGVLPGSEHWTIVTLTPGARPLEELAAHLVTIDVDEDRVGRLLRLQDNLLQDPRTVHTLARLSLADRQPSARLVIIIDQFEELFTLCASEEARRSFLDNMLYASGVAQGRTVVVLTMRTDFYGRAATYPELADRLADRQILVTPMTDDELRQAMEEPARRVGLEFEPGLIEAILDDLEGQPGALPLLEHALFELWHRRRERWLTRDAYVEIEGVGGAIARRADSEYEVLSPEQQAVARRILLRLVQPGEGTEDTRRRALLDELTPDPEHAREVKEVVLTLAGARLLTTSRDAVTGEVLVDVSHEALIRGWPRLRGWIEENRTALRVHRRLAERAREWDRLGRDEGALLRGAQLAQMQELVKALPVDVNALESSFVAASTALAEREAAEKDAQRQRELETARRLAEEEQARRRAEELKAEEAEARAGEQARAAARLRVFTAVLAVLGIAAVVLAVYSWNTARKAEEERQRAERESRVASARQLAAEAAALQEVKPERSLLLAVEALNATRRLGSGGAASIEATLRRGLAEATRSVLLHRGPRQSGILLSQTGRWLVAGIGDSPRLWDLATPGASSVLLRQGKAITFFTFSPEDRWLAVGDKGGTVRLWNPTHAVGNPVVLRGHVGEVQVMRFSADGRWLAVASTEGPIRVWGVGDLSAQPLVLSEPAEAEELSFSPDGRRLLAMDSKGFFWLWNVEQPSRLPVLVSRGEDSSAPSSTAFSNDSRWLVVQTRKVLRLWNLNHPETPAVLLESHERLGRPLLLKGGRWLAGARPIGKRDEVEIFFRDLEHPTANLKVLGADRLGDGNPRTMTLSSQGRWFAMIDGNQAVRVWDLNDLSADPLVLRGNKAYVPALAISPDERWLATGSEDATARIWDLNDPTSEPVVARGHDWAISGLGFTADSRFLVTVSEDGSARLWPLTRPATEPAVLPAFVRHLAFSPDNRWLAAAGDKLLLWKADQPEADPVVLSGHEKPLRTVAFAPTGLRLASAGDDSAVRLWDPGQPGAGSTVLSGARGALRSLAFDPEGRRLVAGGGDVWLWRLDGAAPKPELLDHKEQGDEVVAMAFSPDGKRLVTCSDWQKVWSWDVSQSPARLMWTREFEHEPLGLSPDARWLVTGNNRVDVEVWDLNDPKARPLILHGHDDGVRAVALAPESHLLVSGSRDQTVRLWDLAQPSAEPLVLRGHERQVRAVSLSPDRRLLATASSDGTVRVWHLKVDDLVALACRTVGRNLHQFEWIRSFGTQEFRKTCPDLPLGRR